MFLCPVLKQTNRAFSGFDSGCQILRSMSLASIYVGANVSEGSSASSRRPRAPREQGQVFDKARSASIKLGLLQSKVKHASTRLEAVDKPRLNLVRTVFGNWFHSATAGSVAGVAQACATYTTATGQVDCFDWSANKRHTLSRMKAIGLASHLQEQRVALKRWMESDSCQHAIATCSVRAVLFGPICLRFGFGLRDVSFHNELDFQSLNTFTDSFSHSRSEFASEVTVIHDDTSIILAQEKSESLFTQSGEVSKELSKKGSAKKQSLLGVIQRVAVRRTTASSGKPCQTVQVHVPAQVLPKANAATVRDRLLTWSVYSSSGCSSVFKTLRTLSY